MTASPPMVGFNPHVSELSDAELLGRAVKGARGHSYRKGQYHPRWVAVKDVFALGSTFATQLCVRFDLDPDEMVSR